VFHPNHAVDKAIQIGYADGDDDNKRVKKCQLGDLLGGSMTQRRITSHSILPVDATSFVAFTWQGHVLTARPGEMTASALFAHGVSVFGHHHSDGAPQGIFCANGQCAQCLVLADGKPVKACMTPVSPGKRGA
jgi:hypothetical protein